MAITSTLATGEVSAPPMAFPVLLIHKEKGFVILAHCRDSGNDYHGTVVFLSKPAAEKIGQIGGCFNAPDFEPFTGSVILSNTP